MQRVQPFIRAAAFAAACTAAASVSLHAQTPQMKQPAPPAKPPANQMMSSDDSDFAKKAAEGGMKEVEHGKMVASKATNAQVKAYANRLVKDHTAANNQLKALAKSKKIDLPATAPAGDEPWMSMSGKEFDKAFIDAAVKDHQEDIALFENESERGTDLQLKAYAKKALPTLRAHLKQAQDLQQKLSTSTQ